MIRFFIVRSLLAGVGGYLASMFVPAVYTDGHLATFILFGLFIGVGEVVLSVMQPGISLVLFIIPGAVRMFLARLAIVPIAGGLTTGFELVDPIMVSVAGTVLLISLLFRIPLPLHKFRNIWQSS